MEKQLKLFEKLKRFARKREEKELVSSKPSIEIIKNAYVVPEGLIKEEIVIKRVLLKTAISHNPLTPLFLIKSQN